MTWLPPAPQAHAIISSNIFWHYVLKCLNSHVWLELQVLEVTNVGISDEAEHIMKDERNLLNVPYGMPTFESIEAGRIAKKEK